MASIATLVRKIIEISIVIVLVATTGVVSWARLSAPDVLPPGQRPDTPLEAASPAPQRTPEPTHLDADRPVTLPSAPADPDQTPERHDGSPTALAEPDHALGRPDARAQTAPPVAHGGRRQDLAPYQPDIIVVMVDDLGAIDDRILERLPHISRLWLRGGLRFDAYYNETPLCCPGRASFLTGEHTRRHHVTENRAVLLDPSHTIATALDAVGYQTMLVGKYLNNLGPIDKTPPGWDKVAMLANTSEVDPSAWYVNDERETHSYHDRFVAQQSVTWVAAADPAHPLFLWANPRAPHFEPNGQQQPWMPSVEQRYATDRRCADIARWQPPGYAYSRQPAGFPLDDICRSLLTVDDMIANLTTAMDERGRPTVWVLTSDNGMAWGWHGFPLKNVPEAGRTPLYITAPDISAGATNALISNIDLGPTLAELGAGAMPWADGVSFVDVLHGKQDGRTWLLEDHPLGGNTDGPWGGPWWAIRTPTWHLVERGSEPPALYNLVNDPWEMHPLTDVARTRELEALFPY